MNIDRNDPRLSAYALGEMEEKDKALFEREMDDGARAEVDAIRAMAGEVDAEFRRTLVRGLATSQRRAIARASRGRPWKRLAAAALLLVTAGIFAVDAVQRDSEFWPDTGTEFAKRASPRELDAVVTDFEAAPVNLMGTGGAGGGGGGAEDDVDVNGEATFLEPIDLRTENYPLDEGVKAGAVNQAKKNVLALLRETVESQTARLDPDATQAANREAYDRIVENGFRRTRDQNHSTFSIDVDTASYANVRRFLNSGRLPPKDAVRVEELVNYFRYDYAPPSDGPFATHVELAACPWNARHKLARIAIKGREIEIKKRPKTNIVFLIDVSGSMQSPDKLALLQQGLGLLVEQLDERDRVAIVVYAGAAGCVLGPTSGAKRDVIRAAIENLRAGGSTNGGQGIRLAYALARKHFVKGGVNRVMLCTDGDFNVGVTDRGSLTRLIEEEAKSGVYLSVLGFGTGNYQDASMEELSNRGNGNYAYVDSLREARKVLVEQMSGTLVTIAKDVKIQLFFNPKKVGGWRLIGYENRVLAAQDFNDDQKDAGDIGAGHTVTALYELVPAGTSVPGAPVDPNPFVKEGAAVEDDAWFQLRLRYKRPDGDKSSLIERFVTESGGCFDEASPEFRWAAGVAAFGMLLRESPHVDGANLGAVEAICGGAVGPDPNGHRNEFLGLVRRAASLSADR